jgi:tetratricopeptide (TPR) repeat protein
MADNLAPGISKSSDEELSNLLEQPQSSDADDLDEILQSTTDNLSVNSTEQIPQSSVEDMNTTEEIKLDEKIKDQISLEAPAWIFNPEENQRSGDQDEITPEFEPIGKSPQDMKGVPMTEKTSSETSRVKNESGASEKAGIHEVEETNAERMDAFKWNEKGNGLFNQGAFDDAITAYNKASQLDPSFGMPYSNLALTYLTKGQYAEAILLYQRSIELLNSDKDRALSWNGLGNAYRCINDYANAVAAYQKAAQLDPETAGMRDGTTNIQPGQTPRNAKAWGDLGELFLKMGSFEEAVDAFQKAIELEPGAGRSYGDLAYTFVSQNKYKEAVPLYLKCIDLLEDDKEKAATWNRLGNVYRKLNDYDNAIKAYQKAVVLADEGVDLLTRTRFSLLSNLTVNQ